MTAWTATTERRHLHRIVYRVQGLGTGVIYNVNPRLDLDLGYKYLDAGKATAGNSQAKVATHDFTLGVNYYF